MPESSPRPQRLIVVHNGRESVCELLPGKTVIGRDAACDVILADDEISKRHCEVRVDGDVCRLVDLGSTNGTSLNGQAVTLATLNRGDVITIGSSTLVVDGVMTGTTGPPRVPVPAAMAAAEARAGAASELTPPRPTALRQPLRPPDARRLAPTQTSTTSAAIAVLVLMAVAAGAWYIITHPSTSTVDPTLARITKGRDEVHRTVDAAPKLGAGSIEGAIKTLDAMAANPDYANTVLAGEIAAEKAALAEKLHVLTSRPAPVVDPPATRPEGPSTAPVWNTAEKDRQHFESAVADHRFADAFDALQRLGEPDDMKDAYRTAITAWKQNRKQQFVIYRRDSGFRSARLWLLEELTAFPVNSAAYAELNELARPNGSSPTTPTSQPANLAGAAADAPPDPDAPASSAFSIRCRDIDALLQAHDLDKAAAAITALRLECEAASRPALVASADRMLRQTEAERRLRTALARAAGVGAGISGDFEPITGEHGKLLRIDDAGAVFSAKKGELPLAWAVIPDHLAATLIHRLPLEPAELVDAATTLGRWKKNIEAEATLVRAANRGGPALKPAIDQALADCRGMTLPPEGFKLVGERFLSPQEVARVELNDAIEARSKDLLVGDPAKRQAAYEALVRLGDAAKAPLQRALTLRRLEIRSDLEKNDPTAKKLIALADHRKELDRLRADAFVLINDEVKYPYPYKPEQVGAEKYKLFLETQKEIDKRVALIRTVWKVADPIKLSSGFVERIARLVELAKWQQQLDPNNPIEPDPAWLVNQPESGDVNIRNIALTAKDRAGLDESVRTMIANATTPGKSTPQEADEARITNEYRQMMGRRALRLYDPLTLCARGHTEDMERLGFFAHESPVPGKKTPWDRMEKAGISPIGGSENIAQNGSAQGAHNGWIHSSGHHRNLLMSQWKIFGVGNTAGLWCQNFCVGDAKLSRAGAAPEGGDGG